MIMFSIATTVRELNEVFGTGFVGLSYGFRKEFLLLELKGLVICRVCRAVVKVGLRAFVGVSK